MTVSLPMYLAPREAVQAFWLAVRGALPARTGVALPVELRWPEDLLVHWLTPGLLLSQTCGYPLTQRLSGRVRLLGTPVYDVPGAQGVACRSQLIRRRGDARTGLVAFRGAVVAFNSTDSQSGYNALRALVAPLARQGRFFSAALDTGGHRASIEAVRSGQAALAAIDAVTWALALDAEPSLADQLEVFGQTEPYPGLPLITSLQTPDELVLALQVALHGVTTAPAFAGVCRALHLRGFEITTLRDYASCAAMETSAAALGGHRL